MASARPKVPGWIPGYFSSLPWSSFFALIVVLSAELSSVAVLLISNGMETVFVVSPTVILAVFSAVVSGMFHCALMQSAAMSWWNAALQETTIGSIHRIWDFSTNIVCSIMAGKSVNAIALARIITTAVLINEPLLQRASTIVSYNKTEQAMLSMRVATDLDSLRKAEFSSSLTNIDGVPITVSPALSAAIQQYENSSSIISSLTSYESTTGSVPLLFPGLASALTTP